MIGNLADTYYLSVADGAPWWLYGGVAVVVAAAWVLAVVTRKRAYDKRAKREGFKEQEH